MRDNWKNFLRILLTKKYQLSFSVLIPVFLVLFVLGPMLVAIEHVEKFVPSGKPDALRNVLAMLKLVLGVSVVAALIAGLALSYSILAPLKRFMRNSVPTGRDEKRDRAYADDYAILGRDFSVMMSSLSRHVSILESLSGGVIAFDKDGRVTATNPSAERILVRGTPELLGRPLAELCRTVVISPDMERLVLDGLRHGKAHVSEEVHFGAAGGTLVVGLTTSVLRDSLGGISGVVANFMDLTSVKRMHEDLQQKLRLAGMGRLAAGVAHEVRNPLGAIKGMAQLIQEGLPESDPRGKYAHIIEKETDRLNRVVEDLLSLAHGQTEREPCNINALLAQAKELAKHGLGDKHAEVLDETGEIPEVTAEAGRLVQAFLNVFLNAFEAVPDNGRVRHKTAYLPESGQILIELANTGCPIPPEVKARMFEPFFTTKEKGSGLGLAVAHQIITSHGGAITAESTEEETAIRIVLPAGGVRDKRRETRDEG